MNSLSKRVTFSLSSAGQSRNIILIIAILSFSFLTIYGSFSQLRVNAILCKGISFMSKSNLSDHTKSNENRARPSSSFAYSLDSECKFNPNDTTSHKRKQQFDIIFDTRIWNPVGSRSGRGSSLEGAFDWIQHLRSLFEKYSIRSVADIPCGDTYWQFSLRELNTIDGLYFGGDISTSVINQNLKLYTKKHTNKLFQYWDLVNCPLPTYTFKNATHEIKGNQFDLVIVRDAVQHMNIRNGLRAVRNVIMSGAKFFALSTYPPNGKSSAPIMRSLDKNESLPSIPLECKNKTYCAHGNIQDGSFYPNNINCYPFNFPLDKAILVQASHQQFAMEYDEIHIYPIDDTLKKIVEQYDKACSSTNV